MPDSIKLADLPDDALSAIADSPRALDDETLFAVVGEFERRAAEKRGACHLYPQIRDRQATRQRFFRWCRANDSRSQPTGLIWTCPRRPILDDISLAGLGHPKHS